MFRIAHHFQQTEATRRALEKLTNEKVSAAMPVKRAEQRAPAQYIRYFLCFSLPIKQSVAGHSGIRVFLLALVFLPLTVLLDFT